LTRPRLSASLKAKTPSPRNSNGNGSSDQKNSKPGNGTSSASASNNTPTSSPRAQQRLLQQKVDDNWFEAKLMLRSEAIPTDSSTWDKLARTTSGCDAFIRGLDEEAKKCNVPRAKLLRCLLPFDENTSSGDQAATASGQQKLDLPTACNEVKAKMLAEQAVGLRKLVRVKMADEADLQQAMSAVKMLDGFCNDVQTLASYKQSTPLAIIQGLE